MLSHRPVGCHCRVKEEMEGRRKAEDVRDRDIGCVIALKIPLMDPRAILAQQKHNRRTGRGLGVFLPLPVFREFHGRVSFLLRLWTTDAFAMMIFWGRVLFPRNSPPLAPPNPRTVLACGGSPCGARSAGNVRGKRRANKINSVSVVPFLKRPPNAGLSPPQLPRHQISVPHRCSCDRTWCLFIFRGLSVGTMASLCSFCCGCRGKKKKKKERGKKKKLTKIM